MGVGERCLCDEERGRWGVECGLEIVVVGGKKEVIERKELEVGDEGECG